MELEFDVLGVHGMLVKYVVHLSKRKKLNFLFFSFSHKLPKQQSTNFWSQGILGVNIFLQKINKFTKIEYVCFAYFLIFSQFHEIF
jgi:hypothetical protein